MTESVSLLKTPAKNDRTRLATFAASPAYPFRVLSAGRLGFRSPGYYWPQRLPGTASFSQNCPRGLVTKLREWACGRWRSRGAQGQISLAKSAYAKRCLATGPNNAFW